MYTMYNTHPKRNPKTFCNIVLYTRKNTVQYMILSQQLLLYSNVNDGSSDKNSIGIERNYFVGFIDTFPFLVMYQVYILGYGYPYAEARELLCNSVARVLYKN